MPDLKPYSQTIEKLLAPPFEWCFINAGSVVLSDATDRRGTPGGVFAVGDFAIAKYLITNAQFAPFVGHPNGYANPSWWEYSAQAIQSRQTRKHAHTTAFAGTKVPRTRVSWFESLAFCAWLSHVFVPSSSFSIHDVATWPIRLLSEREWQRAALGDTSGPYPWGKAPVDATRATCANWARQPTNVDSNPAGASPYGVLDMSGNLAEWCLTKWGGTSEDITGYDYRNVRGGAWNIDAQNVFLQAADRYGHPPRGRLNDFGFRIVWHLQREEVSRTR
jgi:formylglycine-generating enzyme required for sulfatase activity